jgi:hypothetical protein
VTFDKVLALPFKNGGIAKVLIGGVLQIIPIVSFFSMGYILECYEQGAKKSEIMPEWTDWGNKFVNGLLIAIISLIYMIIPMILFGSSMSRMFSYPTRHIGGGIFSGMSILGLLVFLAFAFILPMAIANFAAKKNFGAAFQLGYIFQLIGSSMGSYIGAFLLYIVAAIICMIIAMIPIIGWLCIVFISFYLGCVGGFLFGSVYGEASGLAARANSDKTGGMDI